jgi:catabolite regulation protein CreA
MRKIGTTVVVTVLVLLLILVHVSYSDRVVAGSPKSSISSVPVMGWVAP